MSVLRLLISASLLGCCIGYVIVQRPDEYYDYQRQQYAYQWQALEYQPPDYQPSYYSNYYAYYYPITYEYTAPHQPDYKPHLSFDEGQKLLQMYRLIRVIELFRLPPKPKKRTSLDKLVQQLTNPTLQKQLVELVYHVHGYEEVAELDRGHEGYVVDSFVNDIGRLLTAIQRALNALDLDDYDHYHHDHHRDDDHYHHDHHRDDDHYQYQHHGDRYHYRDQYYYQRHEYGYAGLPKELRHELRQLRDEANSLTVAQIHRELKKGAHAHAKEAQDMDLLENLAGEGEAKSLVDELNENYDVVVPGALDDLDNVDKYVVVIDDVEEEPKSRDNQFDDEALEELAAALELYLEEQKITKAHLVREKSQEEVVKELPVVTTTTTTTSPIPTTTTEEAQESWLSSMFGKGNLMPGHQTIDVSEPAVLIEPDTVEFDVGQRLQAETSTEKTSSVSAVTHSVPLWLQKNSDLQNVENKKSEDELDNKDEELLRELPESKQEAEDIAEDATDDARELPESKQEAEDIAEDTTDAARELPESKQEAEDIAEDTTDEAEDRELPESKQEIEEATEASGEETPEVPDDEEKLQLTEEEVEGPAPEDLLADLTDHKMKESTPEPIPAEEQTEHEPLEEQSTPEPATEEPTTPSPLNIYEVHTERAPAESREQQSSLPAKAASEPDARRFVKEEVMKVLSLLEEANGFSELKDHISEPDVDQLVDGLSDVDVGIRWTEMISALQKLVEGKQLDRGERIVDVLEHWKEGEEGHLDDGYFDRTYGEDDAVENRELIDGEEAEMKSIEDEEKVDETSGTKDDDQSETSSEHTPFVDDVDNFFDTTYGLNNKTSNGSRVHNETVEQVKNETMIANSNSTSEIPAEDRSSRTINVDEEKEIDHSTQNPSEVDPTSSENPQQEEEITEKLEESTAQPFPDDETESVALD